MHNLSELLTHALGIYESVRDGQYVAASRHVLDLLKVLLDELDDAGFKASPPPDDAEKKQVDEILDNLKAAKKDLQIAKKKTVKGKKAAVGADEAGITPAEILFILNIIIKLFQRWRGR